MGRDTRVLRKALVAVFLCSTAFLSFPQSKAQSLEVNEPPQPVIVVEKMPQPDCWRITAEERELVIRAVAGTAGDYNGQLAQMAVAQCIRDACFISGDTVSDVVERYRYHLTETVSVSAAEAVDAVINGASVSSEVILYCCGAEGTSFHHTRNKVACFGDLTFYN